jgi:DNA-binding transcriptional ArsR family regulator
LPSEKGDDILRGRTLQVYRFIVKRDEPARIREMQRSLSFSSPSLVMYHVDKLKKAGLVKEEGLGFVADKIVLRNVVRFRAMLIPRYFFYFLFFSLGAVLEITLFRPLIITREYLIGVLFTAMAAMAFGFETYSHLHGI